MSRGECRVKSRCGFYRSDSDVCRYFFDECIIGKTIRAKERQMEIAKSKLLDMVEVARIVC